MGHNFVTRDSLRRIHRRVMKGSTLRSQPRDAILSGMRFQPAALAAAVLLGGACTGDTDEPDHPQDGFVTLAETTWEAAPGDNFFCLNTTLTEDISLDALE